MKDLFTGVRTLLNLPAGDRRNIDFEHLMTAFVIDDDGVILGLRCHNCQSVTRLKLKYRAILNDQALQDKFEELKQAHIRARLNEE